MSEFVNECKNRVVILGGAVLLSVIGRRRFYQLTQGESPVLRRLASRFCEGHVARLVNDYAVQVEGRDKTRISAAALRLYSDDSLAGYGDAEFAKTDGKPLLEQQRGLIIPLVQAEMHDFERTHGRPPKVLEIGVANGDVLAYLAGAHPAVSFVGVDLSVVNAERKHQIGNLQFVKGYSLGLIEDGNPVMAADIVFGTSTFCALVPKEFKAHVDYFARSGTTSIVISDPVTAGQAHQDNDGAVSKHMSHYMWWHNYAGYLRQAGYTIPHFEQRRFAYSWNPGAVVALVVGRRKTPNV